MPEGGLSVWIGAAIGALATGLGRIIAFIPNLLGAIVVLLIGWGIGKLIQALVTKGLQAVHFNRMTENAGINDALKRANINTSPAAILGIIAYWFVFLLAINAAVGILGIPTLTALMSAVILYLPRIIGAILVIVVGAWAANLLARITRGSAAAAGISYADLLGNIVLGAVLFFTFAIALDVLGIAFPFLTTAFAIILGAFALAGAIAFGLGGREYASDVLAGRELKTLLKVGDRVVTDEVDGTVSNINPTFTVVKTTKGDTAVQNRELMMKGVTKSSSRGEGGGPTSRAA